MAKHSVVVVNWLLKQFSSPLDIGSMTELRVLYNAWKTGTVTFRQLTLVEWEDWEAAHFNTCMAELQQVDGGVGSQLQMNNSTVQSTIAEHCLPSESFQSPLPMPTPLLQLDGHGAQPAFASFRLSTTWTADTQAISNARTVLGVNGQGVIMVKKLRKTWSDKGKKRGPRSGAASMASTLGGVQSMPSVWLSIVQWLLLLHFTNLYLFLLHSTLSLSVQVLISMPK